LAHHHKVEMLAMGEGKRGRDPKFNRWHGAKSNETTRGRNGAILVAFGSFEA
jgi:asparagine synthetase A